MTVLAKDGTPLHVEVDGPEDAEVSVVLCHGWLADLTTWEAQRIGLADTQVRRVFYDHRGHGLSGGRGMDAKEQGVRELADDLAAVIDAAAPTGRLILIGHSMGGMTLMAFTQRHPEVLRERVDGVVLCATGASPLGSHMTLGLPSWMVPAHKVIRRYTLETLLLIGLLPLRIARILGIGPWLWGARLLACGPKAPEAAVVLTAGSIYRTPMRVGADCMHAVTCHDERESIASLHDVPTTVVVPGRDRLLPNPMQQELVELVDRVNDPKVIPVPDRGHMVMLEAPEVVNAELHRMIERSQDLLAQRRLAAPAPDPLVTSPSQT